MKTSDAFLFLGSCLFVAACGSSSGSNSPDGSSPDGGATGCTLTANTTATTTANSAGCHVLSRDTSSCQSARTAQGLSSFWLKFSCRVTLTKNGNTLSAVSDQQPDYKSMYFPTSNACYQNETSGLHNPNEIVAKSLTVNISLTPNTVSGAMMGAVVGMALNGVPVFSNFAAPGDDIYKEAMTFDACGGHPQMSGQYHYHGEPYALSYDDSNLIAVLRDGYPVYGRKDSDGSYPTLDSFGGHTGVTPDSTTPTYHYHVNQQTSTNSGTLGQKQYFLTTGTYRGQAAACPGCM